jgi:hypothetical protein
VSISIKAHKLLKEKFPLTEVFTQYVAKFETRSGRELALEKNRTEAIFLWLQKYDQTIEGVEIKNEKFPGQPYDSKQPRNSNINEKNTPKLKVGKKAFYLQIDNLDALNKVVDWYANL